MGFLGLAGVVLGLIFAARRDRRDKERDQRESTERLEAIRAGQLATLAAHVLHRGKIVELAVVNQGPGPAVLMSVEALGHPDLFMGSQTFGDQLLQGDKHVLLVALSLALHDK